MRTPITERARRYVLAMDKAVSGQRGHDTTFRVAVALVQGFGFSPGEALPIMQDWNAALDEQWTDQDLMHKLRDAERAGSNRGTGYLISQDYQNCWIGGRPKWRTPAPSTASNWADSRKTTPIPQNEKQTLRTHKIESVYVRLQKETNR